MQISEKNLLADRINEIVDARNTNLKDLAAELKFPYSSLHNYASGRSEPRASLFVALYEKIGINLDWFVGEEGEMYRADRPTAHKDSAVAYGKESTVVHTNNGNIVSGVRGQQGDPGGRGLLICSWVQQYVETHSAEDASHLAERMRRAFPEFESWARGKRSDS